MSESIVKQHMEAVRQKLVALEWYAQESPDHRSMTVAAVRDLSTVLEELFSAVGELQEDIQHRQRIEDMLRRSEHRYRTLFDSAGDAIFITDLEGRFLEVNRVACERLGYSREELLQLGAAAINAPQFAPELSRRIEEIRRLGSLAFESAHRRRDGVIIPIELNNRVIEYAGAPAILSIARDITERKHAENKLRRYADEQAALYEMALRLSVQLNTDELLRLLVEQAISLLGALAGGVYLYDGQQDKLVLAVGVDFFSEYVGTELKPGEGLSGRAFQSRQVMKVEDYHTWEARAAVYANDGRLRSVVAIPLVGKHAVRGVLVVAGDDQKQQFDDHDARLTELFAAQAAITLENAQLYEAQQEQYRRLQESQARLIQSEKMSALGRLTASIAHEINNPLQAIQGCLTLVREGLTEDIVGFESHAAMLHDLDVASAEVTRIAAIMQRLREFYRPARADVQVADVNGILDAVLVLTAGQLQQSRVTLERTSLADEPAAPLLAKSNADQLKQVFLNLVLNAIEALPEGGALRIATGLDVLVKQGKPRPAVRIDFTDTGKGIPPETLTRVFEPFFTTKESGSGLGLSISYELVESFGGELTATSRVGQGTTFTVRLPLESRP